MDQAPLKTMSRGETLVGVERCVISRKLPESVGHRLRNRDRHRFADAYLKPVDKAHLCPRSGEVRAAGPRGLEKHGSLCQQDNPPGLTSNMTIGIGFGGSGPAALAQQRF